MIEYYSNIEKEYEHHLKFQKHEAYAPIFFLEDHI